MSKTRPILFGAAALFAVVAGLPIYVLAWTQPVHSRPENVPSAAHAQPAPQWSDAVERARRIVRTGIVEQNLPGLSVAVGAGGNVVWAEGFGWSDIQTRATVTPRTRFRIGTASTALTAAAVGVLVEKGRLALDQEIQTYVPEYPKKPWPVTLRQLLADSAGIATDSEDDRPLSRQRCERPVDAVPQFAGRALLFEPGTQRSYSSYGWILVSAAVEAAANQPFLTVMQDQLFTPMGMEDTGAEPATRENPEDIGGPGEDPPPFTLIRDLILAPLGIAGRREKPATEPATLYTRGWGPKPVPGHGIRATHPRNLSCYAGGRALFSTPSDLVRFGLAKNGDITGEAVTVITLRERGILVAVTSNASYADTATLARRVAEAF